MKDKVRQVGGFLEASQRKGLLQWVSDNERASQRTLGGQGGEPNLVYLGRGWARGK